MASKREISTRGEASNTESPRTKRVQIHKQSLRRCIKVPEPGRSPARILYESFDADVRRQRWAEHLLGPDGMYVGRPKHDGGWYQVPCVKQGSFQANPFPVKEFGLEECLLKYEAYLHKRMTPGVELAALISLLPEKDRRAAVYCFVECSKTKGKSVKHLELLVRGAEFVERLVQIKGQPLACFCDPSSACHVDVLLRVLASLD
jgi:hypothetical protein